MLRTAYTFGGTDFSARFPECLLTMRSFGLRVSGAVAPSASPPPLPDEAELSRLAIRPNPGGDNKIFAEAANPVNQSFHGFTQRYKQKTHTARKKRKSP